MSSSVIRRSSSAAVRSSSGSFDKENHSVASASLVPVKPPVKPPQRPLVPALNVAIANQCGVTDRSSDAQTKPFMRKPTTSTQHHLHDRHQHREPLACVKQVDSDVESDDDDIVAITTHLPPRRLSIARRPSLTRLSAPTSQSSTPVPAAPSTASSFRRSAAVSRHTSDVATTATGAAGTAFQLLRFGATSATSTPTHFVGGASFSSFTGRSRSNSLVSIHQVAVHAEDNNTCCVPETLGGRLTRETSLVSGQHNVSGHVSRMTSMTSSRIGGCPTPDTRMHLKAMMVEEAHHALEENMARRHQLYAPENVLLRRWMVVMAIAASAKVLVESGGRRVAEYNAVQRARYMLGRLFVPVLRLHQAKRHRMARECLQRFILRAVMRRRAKQRVQATDLIRGLFQNKLAMFQKYAKYFTRCVITIQRAFRLFKQKRDAMVELNCRFVRKLEASYWKSAADGAQQVLDRQFLRFLADDAEKKKSASQRRRPSLTCHDDADFVPPAVPSAFPTLESLGRFPESTLKKNLRPLISSRSRAWRKEVIRRTNVAFETFKRSQGGNGMASIMKCPEMCRRVITVKLPPFRAFLTMDEAFAAFDNCARTLSQMRSAPVIALHLADGRQTAIPSVLSSEEDPFLRFELSETSLRSDRLMETSTDTRRCSVSNMLTSSFRPRK